jgi:hypothetical protein
LVYYYELPAEAVAYGSHSTTEPFTPPLARSHRTYSGWIVKEPPRTVSVRRDSESLLKALGWYREGLNTGSPFYRFVAHWNCLEAALGRSRRPQFIKDTVRKYASSWTAYPLPTQAPEQHYRQLSRDAIAHVSLHPGKTPIDPDADPDRQRLDAESRFLQQIAREAIRQEFDQPVSVGPRP